MRRNSNSTRFPTSRCIPSMSPPAGAVQCSSIWTLSILPDQDPAIHAGSVIAAAKSTLMIMDSSLALRLECGLEISDKRVVDRVALAQEPGRRDAGKLAEF